MEYGKVSFLLANHIISLSMTVPQGLKKQAYYSASMVTKIEGNRRKCIWDCSLLYSLNDALSFQLPLPYIRYITQSKIFKDAERF